MSTHKCPSPNCDRRVGATQFACRPHWYALPQLIRDAIWRGYRSGQVEEHVDAMAEAIEWYREQPR